jgi:proliferating cell nuclear antigen
MRISNFEMRAMVINRKHLRISKIEYEEIVRMPSTRFAWICNGFNTIGNASRKL